MISDETIHLPSTYELLRNPIDSTQQRLSPSEWKLGDIASIDHVLVIDIAMPPIAENVRRVHRRLGGRKGRIEIETVRICVVRQETHILAKALVGSNGERVIRRVAIRP